MRKAAGRKSPLGLDQKYRQANSHFGDILEKYCDKQSKLGAGPSRVDR